MKKAAVKVRGAVRATKKSVAARSSKAGKAVRAAFAGASTKPGAPQKKAVTPTAPKPPAERAIRGKQMPLGGSALASRNEEDDYTPHQLSTRAPFRGSGGADADDELPTEVSTNARFSDEDRFTNHSNDPRIGTHNRTYEPAESAGSGGADTDDDDDLDGE